MEPASLSVRACTALQQPDKIHSPIGARQAVHGPVLASPHLWLRLYCSLTVLLVSFATMPAVCEASIADKPCALWQAL